MELHELPNIGRVNADKLRRAGVETPEQLRELGSKEAFFRVRLHADPGACVNMLCGLEGAISGIRWHDPPAETKTDLKQFFRGLNGK